MTNKTTTIQIERQPSPEQLHALGVFQWPVWTKAASEFSWIYAESETCYFLSGDVVVTPDGEEPVQMGKGDLVTFPAHLSCTWEILQDVEKHYRFG